MGWFWPWMVLESTWTTCNVLREILTIFQLNKQLLRSKLLLEPCNCELLFASLVENLFYLPALRDLGLEQ